MSIKKTLPSYVNANQIQQLAWSSQAMLSLITWERRPEQQAGGDDPQSGGHPHRVPRQASIGAARIGSSFSAKNLLLPSEPSTSGRADGTARYIYGRALQSAATTDWPWPYVSVSGGHRNARPERVYVRSDAVDATMPLMETARPLPPAGESASVPLDLSLFHYGHCIGQQSESGCKSAKKFPSSMRLPYLDYWDGIREPYEHLELEETVKERRSASL